MNDPGPYVTICVLWPSPSRREIWTCPERMRIKPIPSSPTFANAAPASYRRILPNRRTRSISKGSSTGNIWSCRVSMTDGEVDMMLGQRFRPSRYFLSSRALMWQATCAKTLRQFPKARYHRTLVRGARATSVWQGAIDSHEGRANACGHPDKALINRHRDSVSLPCDGGLPTQLTDSYSSLASSVISALRTLETGQFFSASFAISANL